MVASMNTATASMNPSCLRSSTRVNVNELKMTIMMAAAAVMTGAAHREDPSAADRHDLVAEMVRLGAVRDFEAVYGSPEWRTYLALHATFLSLPDGTLRDEIQEALRRSEQSFIERIARAWESLAAVLGYRLRPTAGGSFETIATLVSATLRGLVTMALSNAELATRRVQANPAGASTSAEWSLVGMAAASIAATFLEPDPDFTWDEQRLASLRQLLDGEGVS